MFGCLNRGEREADSAHDDRGTVPEQSGMTS